MRIPEKIKEDWYKDPLDTLADCVFIILLLGFSITIVGLLLAGIVTLFLHIL